MTHVIYTGIESIPYLQTGWTIWLQDNSPPDNSSPNYPRARPFAQSQCLRKSCDKSEIVFGGNWTRHLTLLALSFLHTAQNSGQVFLHRTVASRESAPQAYA
jgi:hypothetical protein